MHSALFVLENSSFASQIRKLLRMRDIPCCFAHTEEEALAVMECNEIAVAMISLSLTSTDVKRLAKKLLHKNERLQLLLLFEKADIRSAIFLHNTLFCSGLFCRELLSAEELLEKLKAALLHYGEDDGQEQRKDAFLEKETEYENRMFQVSSLLNDRMESYREIIRHFHLCGRHLPGIGSEISQTECMADVLSCHEQILEDFIQIHLLREPLPESFFAAAAEKFDHPSLNKYYKITNEVTGDIAGDTFQNIAFLLSVLSSYFDYFYSEYRARVIVSEVERCYLLDILYEIDKYETMKKAGKDLAGLNEKLLSVYAAKAVYRSKGNRMQYKIYFARSL
ncbi:MAG: hypothetical protein QM697_03740 [Lachnospiraceae bacterium]